MAVHLLGKIYFCRRCNVDEKVVRTGALYYIVRHNRCFIRESINQHEMAVQYNI